MQNILITGFGGFIGYSLVQHLKSKYRLAAFDNFSTLSNYDIKLARAKRLGIEDFNAFTGMDIEREGVKYYYADLCDAAQLEYIFSANQFNCIVHLAALTGVRQSLLNPAAYIDANVKGFVNLAECARRHGVQRFIYASSSSVYGLNTETPYTEDQRTDSPISVYAASKKTCELLAHSYAHLYGMNMTGLRFFTVYGPWTRPDMAAFIFMKAIEEGKEIELFNDGKMIRDFTYVDDVTTAITMLIEKQDTGKGTHQVLNVGNHKPVYTIEFLKCIEAAMGKKAIIRNKPVQPGDMLATNAGVEKLQNTIGFQPQTTMEEGVERMVRWFKDFYPSFRP